MFIDFCQVDWWRLIYSSEWVCLVRNDESALVLQSKLGIYYQIQGFTFHSLISLAHKPDSSARNAVSYDLNHRYCLGLVHTVEWVDSIVTCVFGAMLITHGYSHKAREP
jgi:hypothetical protein